MLMLTINHNLEKIKNLNHYYPIKIKINIRKFQSNWFQTKKTIGSYITNKSMLINIILNKILLIQTLNR